MDGMTRKCARKRCGQSFLRELSSNQEKGEDGYYHATYYKMCPECRPPAKDQSALDLADYFSLPIERRLTERY